MKLKYHAMVDQAVKAIHAYYIDDNPILSDGEYDELVRQIAAVEAEHPDWLREDSPTRHVGGYASSSFAKVKHPRSMLSLKNAFSEEDLKAFAKSIDAVVDVATRYVVEPKLDGLTLVCSYANGALVSAVTRGDGLIGEDVTANAMVVASVPKVVDYKEPFQVRGEVVMPRVVFERLNLERAKNGEAPFANPRNAAAGSIRQKDPMVTASRLLSYCVYDVFGVPEIYLETGKLKWLEGRGFFSINSLSKTVDSIEEAWNICKEAAGEFREKLPVDIDGMVIKADSLQTQKLIGETPVFPRWAIAYKFPQQHKEAILVAVNWQVGRGGSVTPVAIFSPVELGGATVTHASLHNVRYVRALGLNAGDVLSIYKAAEIIPQVASVLRKGTGTPIEVPTECPQCRSTLEECGVDGTITLMCKNPHCPEREAQMLEYFACRACMDIDGLGIAMAHLLVDNDLCHSPADLYTLTKERLKDLPLCGPVRIANLLKEIEASKQRPATRVLAALGIPEIGQRMAEILLGEWKSISKMVDALVLDSGSLKVKLADLPGIGIKKAEAIVKGLTNAETLTQIARLRAAGLQMEVETTEHSGSLSNQVFCITGTLSKPRAEVVELIKKNGGTVVNTITSSVTYLLAGAEGGRESTKKKAALRLHIPVITEEEFKEML